jgi:hypothetical protein
VKTIVGDITLTSAAGYEFGAFVIGWRVWRWVRWWMSKERGWVTVTRVDGSEQRIRFVRAKGTP